MIDFQNIYIHNIYLEILISYCDSHHAYCIIVAIYIIVKVIQPNTEGIINGYIGKTHTVFVNELIAISLRTIVNDFC